MPTNNSTVWTQLASPNSPVGSIPFVDIDGTGIVTDVTNFFYTAENGDTSGTKLAGQLSVLKGLRVGYQDRTSTPGSVTINEVAGRVLIAAGQSALTVTCSKCFTSSIVQVTIETADVTLIRIVPVRYNGSFVLSGNAAATAGVTVAFLITNVAA